jgi:hypothetical protein
MSFPPVDLATPDRLLRQAVLDLIAGSDIQLLKDALVSGANPNLRDDIGRPLLVVAASRVNLAAIGALLVAGADPNAMDKNRRTCLLEFSASSPNLETHLLCNTIGLLIAHGADPCVREISGYLPHHSLVIHHCESVEQWLPLISDTPERVAVWGVSFPTPEGRIIEPPDHSWSLSVRQKIASSLSAITAQQECLILDEHTNPAGISSSPFRL